MHDVYANLTCSGELLWTYVTNDNQYAVTYQCAELTLEGSTCQHKVIDVISRTQDFPQIVRTVLSNEVQKLCVNPRDLIATNFSGLPKCCCQVWTIPYRLYYLALIQHLSDV